MTAYFHTPLMANSRLNSLALSQPLKALDFVLYQLAHGELDFLPQDVQPAIPGAGLYKLYMRNRDLTLQDDTGVESRVYSTEKYVQIIDLKATSDGGSFSSGGWRTRTLNTFLYGENTFATLDSDQITLESGIYRIAASAPAVYVNGHMIRWYNTSDSSEVTAGNSSYAVQFHQTRSWLGGEFTIAAEKTFELQHRCQTTNAATNGRGEGSNWGNAIFTIVELWKL